MGSPSSGMCWPTPAQERLLEACFCPGDRARQALAKWRNGRDLAAIDLTSTKILPMLFRRHGEPGLDSDLYEKAYLSYCSTWQRNQKRLLAALALIRDMKDRPFEPVLRVHPRLGRKEDSAPLGPRRSAPGLRVEAVEQGMAVWDPGTLL